MIVAADMSQQIRLSYIHVEDEVWNKFELACDRLGWQSKNLLQQIVHSFFARHRDYYCRAAIADAKAREMTEQPYYETLKGGSEEDLNRYIGQRPNFGPSPLATVPDPIANKETRRRYNLLTLGDFNYVLLKVAMIVERASIVELTSRITLWHFNEYWEKLYLPQIQHDEQRRFLLEK
ncbi:MAG: hypothetical protein AAF921_17950 [Cyanobacteria bacterium P01_D01_bin.44]